MLTGIALVGTITAAVAPWFVGNTEKANRKAAEEDEDQAQVKRSILWPNPAPAEIVAVRPSLEASLQNTQIRRT